MQKATPCNGNHHVNYPCAQAGLTDPNRIFKHMADRIRSLLKDTLAVGSGCFGHIFKRNQGV